MNSTLFVTNCIFILAFTKRLMRNLTFIILLVTSVFAYAQEQNQPANSNKNVRVERENLKAFLESDLDRYVVYDLMSDGSKVFKDTLDFNEYRDKAIFTITQNQTILNRQLWVTIILLTITISLLIFVIRKK